MRRVIAAFIAGCVLAAPAQALVNCSASASGVNFGIYNPLNAAVALSTGTISITCTLLSGGATTVPLRVDLSAGSSGSFATRLLRSPPNTLGYNLFWSAAYTQVWGDGTGGSFYGTGSLFLNPGNPTRTANGAMYGRIPALQDVNPGSYLDTIIVTVTY
jgi:spore coat protein U-like protein